MKIDDQINLAHDTVVWVAYGGQNLFFRMISLRERWRMGFLCFLSLTSTTRREMDSRALYEVLGFSAERRGTPATPCESPIGTAPSSTETRPFWAVAQANAAGNVDARLRLIKHFPGVSPAQLETVVIGASNLTY